MILIILGRQPKIGLAELETLFGSEAVVPLGESAALVEATVNHALARPIGSAMKIAKVTKVYESTKWQTVAPKITKTLENTLPKTGKITLGISAYGFTISTREIQKTGIILKQRLKKAGGSLRLIPQDEPALNTAQVLHNKLGTSENKREIIIVKGSDETFIAETIQVQDIDAYTFRDRSRPKRDARVGMLPPKLAQTIINLAQPATKTSTPRLLDPFCGTGVLLQEAALMGYKVYGTDLDPRMITYSKENLEWLARTHKINVAYTLEEGDATAKIWEPPLDVIACETYLGQPFSAPPAPDKLREVMNACNSIVREFLKNLAPQIASGTPLCLGVPAWHIKNRIYHLSILDSLAEIGYNRRDFTHAQNTDLVYRREDQIVGRELLVLTRS